MLLRDNGGGRSIGREAVRWQLLRRLHCPAFQRRGVVRHGGCIICPVADFDPNVSCHVEGKVEGEGEREDGRVGGHGRKENR